MIKRNLPGPAPLLIVFVSISILGAALFTLTTNTQARSFFRRKPLPKITVKPTAIPTTKPTTVTPTSVTPTAVTPTSGASSSHSSTHTTTSGESKAFGVWDPANAYFASAGPSSLPVCSKAEHDRFFVLGPDGLKYPTWHPPVITDSTGKRCTFGHEHGRDPSKYEHWATIKRHFAFDANHDGTIQDSEFATSGVPFGYVNQQLDLAALGHTRHEDHVGHKVEFVNGELDNGGADRFSDATTGGIVIPAKSNTSGNKWVNSGVSCYFFHKIHQGVHSPDAFTNNIHEAILHSKCTSTRSDYQANETLISGFIAFGNTGEFTRFCGADRTQVIKVSTDANSVKFPKGSQDSMRNISTRDCVESTVLVPEGQWSGFPYEIWSGSLNLTKADGSLLATINGGWEVLDAIRYYDPNATNKIRFMSDICYETLGNRRTRGGECDIMTNYGAISGITWNDVRSSFKGLHRGQYMDAPTINNAGGSTVWYTNPHGGNASTSQFTGSIKQLVPNVATRIQFDHDPRNTLRDHVDGNGTVHAPN